MSRIRTIKPSAFRSLTLAAVPRDARWLFAGLWTECDDAGRLVDHPGLINAAIFPLDKLPDELVDGWLDKLEEAGALCRYTVDGDHYLHPVKWQHQRINKPTPSTLPECPKHRAAASPAQLASVANADPRRCSRHQNELHPMACGACKEARLAHEDAVKNRPTFSAKTTMCGEHPEHPARACPECAAEAAPPPADWRDRQASS